VALESGLVVAYGWLSSGPEWIGELGLELRPAPGEAYVWNCATLPAHRRKGLFSAMLRAIAAQARREGLVRLWIGSVEIPAQKAVGGAGFVPALQFEVEPHGKLRSLKVSVVDAADAGLVMAARQRLGPDGAPLKLGLSMEPVRARRH
jgi:GNAT superfamily N-acetyltransferase